MRWNLPPLNQSREARARQESDRGSEPEEAQRVWGMRMRYFSSFTGIGGFDLAVPKENMLYLSLDQVMLQAKQDR